MGAKKEPYKLVVLIQAIVFCACPPSPAQINFRNFERLTIDNGLSQNFVAGIAQDSRGFLWFGTRDGLNRYDGYHFKIYSCNAADSTSLSANAIRAVYADRRGNLWVGTHSAGLNRYDLATNSFVRYQHHSQNPYSLSHDDVQAIFENRGGALMEGFDADWIRAGPRPEATYTNLDPGEYTFRVKGSNNDGIWNEEGASLRLSITPPWWQTWWFRVAGLAAAIVLIIFIHQTRIRGIKKRTRLLQEEVDHRKHAETRLQNALAEISQLKERLEAENVYLRQEIKLEQTFGEITGQSEAIKKMVSGMGQVVSTDATVLILGETGTGKELLANAIHNHGSRKDKMMVKVNCASLPAALIESELFGREKGAYTGAMNRQAGRFEIAEGSTIFLDEIGELPLELQPKLLRVLQEGEFERLGSPKTIKVNVRVIAATNRDLAEEVRLGNFREDLYYRLNVFPIQVPPLRERAEDIPLLVWAFINELGQKMGKQIQSVPKKTMEMLQGYKWPGNIRQLRNVIEHALIISTGKTLQIQLPEQSTALSQSNGATLEQIEIKHITEVLKKTNWRIKGPAGAAAVLGLNPGTLYSKMKKLGIPTNRGKVDNSTKD